MMHHIVRLRPEQSGMGAAIGVARAGSGAAPEQRIGQLLPPGQVPAHTPLALLWRGPSLSSPDTLALAGAAWHGHTLAVTLELRCFDGPLHANIITVPIVELDLGELAPASYEADIALVTLAFSDLDRPETAVPVRTEHSLFRFTVV